MPAVILDSEAEDGFLITYKVIPDSPMNNHVCGQFEVLYKDEFPHFQCRCLARPLRKELKSQKAF